MEPETAAVVVDTIDTPTLESTPAPDIAPEMSLEDFKQAFPKTGNNRPEAGTETPPPARHRAKSQLAAPDDVKAIGEYTKRIKEAEAAAGADIKQQAGESNRVYELRRRAELAERHAAANAEPPAVSHQPPTVSRTATVSLPAVKDAASDSEPDPTKYEDLTKYFRDQAMWAGRETLRQARAEEETARRTHEQAAEVARLTSQWVSSVTTAKAEYADFEKVAFGPLNAPGFPHLTEIPQGSLIDAWILEKPYGAKLLYTLKKTPNEFARLMALQPGDQVEELTLLGQRLKGRTPAVTTGAAAAMIAQPVSRPPTPVRTGPMRTGDETSPDPESLSLSSFREAYQTERRRR